MFCLQSTPIRLLVALSGIVVAAIGTAPRGRVSLGIDTLIANILVNLVLSVRQTIGWLPFSFRLHVYDRFTKVLYVTY